MPKMETADSVLPHTEAKLQFYSKYLERYLAILLQAAPVEQINVFDIFCGAGVYADGNAGSAIRATDAIRHALENSGSGKPIHLHLNDKNPTKVARLSSSLSKRSSDEGNCTIYLSENEATDFLAELPSVFSRQSKSVRNLIFIDPYGYKAIDKGSLEALLETGRTELILFLPIEQMYRFKSKTVNEEVEASYRPLKQFVDQFCLDVSSIGSEKEFIRALEKALKFNDKTYATSYAIKNHSGHYYGMFFVTRSIYGLQKILEVKWDLDQQCGTEFTGSTQADFFLEIDRRGELAEVIEARLKKERLNNSQIYFFILQLGFLPKHVNKLLKSWEKEGLIDVYDIEKGAPARKGSFKITFDTFRSNVPTRIFSWKSA
ncbi:MAG: hypothetical protein CALGDGBN_03286 [Pseudomonadales bacterium]|nr:hypothetical protein [Pseudomonadales bacterium]